MRYSQLLEHIVSPTLLLHEERCRNNIASMVNTARRNRVGLRPHFKTHQSLEIGRWLREEGVEKATVSSLSMAEYFAADGWKDITLAVPANPNQNEGFNTTNASGLNLLVADPYTAKALDRGLRVPRRVFIELDTGDGRTGIPVKKMEDLAATHQTVLASPHLEFAGLLTHAGHSYKADSREEIQEIHQRSVDAMLEVQNTLDASGIISIGDTPCCTVAQDLSGADEIRPGNFVFFDEMQVKLGSCRREDVALLVAAPVIQVNAEDKKLVVHCGAVHLSKEILETPRGDRTFGSVARLDGEAWGDPYEDTHVVSLSQEHGIIRGPLHVISRFKPGDLVGIIPIHSCLTADLMGAYTTLCGKPVDHMRRQRES